jgi:hypothetical protein
MPPLRRYRGCVWMSNDIRRATDADCWTWEHAISLKQRSVKCLTLRIRQDAERIAELEQENAALKAELDSLPPRPVGEKVLGYVVDMRGKKRTPFPFGLDED